MKKIFFAAVFAGALLGFTSCGNREMVTDPEMETVIDSIKETQSGQTTEETTAGTEETAEVSTQTEPTEGQSEIQGSEWVQFTTEDHEGSSDPEDKTRSYTYYYPTVTVTIPGNETVQMKIQKELDEYVDSFVEGIKNGEFGTLYEDMPVYEQSYEDLTFHVIRADDKVISLSWGLEGYDQGVNPALSKSTKVTNPFENMDILNMINAKIKELANVPIPNIADYKLVNEKGATKYYEVKELNTGKTFCVDFYFYGGILSGWNVTVK